MDDSLQQMIETGNIFKLRKLINFREKNITESQRWNIPSFWSADWISIIDIYWPPILNLYVIWLRRFLVCSEFRTLYSSSSSSLSACPHRTTQLCRCCIPMIREAVLIDLCKLEKYGVGGKLLQWIKMWLTGSGGRRVCLQWMVSDWVEVSSGVPRGSVQY